MKIVGINSHPSGSTRTIMNGILDVAESNGYEVYSFSGNWKLKSYTGKYSTFGYQVENNISAILSQMSGLHGVWSIVGTLVLVKKLKKIQPDVIHLHNLHLWTINIPILLHYINENHIPVIWTLHDCWSITGLCTHFLQNQCTKWTSGCYQCDNLLSYPFAKFDNTIISWKIKKRWFTGIENLNIVVPSEWLAGIIKRSFLKNFPIHVINNGIDLTIYKRIDSDFRIKNKIKDETKIILGVASVWGQKKGLDVFIKLADDVDLIDYRIVLVGTNEEIDKMLPSNIISVHRTNSQKDLAAVYNVADVFINPTREDNFPTTNIEALACGVPVITFDVGGSREMLNNQCGIAIKCDDYPSLKDAIFYICRDGKMSRDSCIKNAQKYNREDKFREYIDLYKDVVKNHGISQT